MKKRISILLIFLMLFAVCMAQGSTFADTANESVEYVEMPEEKFLSKATIDQDFVGDSVLVVMDKKTGGINKTHSSSFFEDFAKVSVRDLTSVDGDVAEQRYLNREEFRQILEIKLPQDDKNEVLNAIRVLEKIDGVMSAEPNYFLQAQAMPNDQSFNDATFRAGYGTQWALENPVSGTNYGIRAFDAWNYSYGSQNVRIGIIDTGIAAHPDLNANVVAGWNFVTNNADTNDIGGHGTAVAGVVGARGNNGIGVSGVCWNVSLVPLKIGNDHTDLTMGRAADAINWARNQKNIPILNFSHGSYTETNLLKTAINNYTGLFICAAGNYNSPNDTSSFYPSNYTRTNPKLISVGAINALGNRWNDSSSSGSNYGTASVDLFAPGVAILTTTIASVPYDYDEYTGSSFAAPHVAGVAALLLSYESSLTAAELKSIVVNSVTKYSAVSGLCKSGGRLDAYEALKSVNQYYIQMYVYAKSGSEWAFYAVAPSGTSPQYNAKLCFADDARKWKNLSDLKSFAAMTQADLRIKENLFATTATASYVDQYGHRRITLKYSLSLNNPSVTEEITIYKPHVNS
ncbi:MAG: S8 family serine peptidase [Firmicutes bacterium]|nr:S8 family serine peptidase [Bacillota bacterium]